MRAINHESRRLSHNTGDGTILNSNYTQVSSTPSPFVRREKCGSPANHDFPNQQSQHQQIDIIIDSGFNCMQSENNTADQVFDFITNCRNKSPSRHDIDQARNLCSDLGYVDRVSDNTRQAGQIRFRNEQAAGYR